MFPFRRKKEEEAIGDDLPQKPVRRRKKKEESYKPWGKKERLVVFGILVLIPILSVFFLIRYNRDNTSEVLGTQTLERTFDISVLKNNLISETRGLKGSYGIWFQTIDGSYSFGINEKNQFDGASLFKLPLMILYYEKVDSGDIDPSTTYTLKYSDAAAGAGTLASMQPGTQISYRDIIEAMGKNSDNTGFSIMLNVLGASSSEFVSHQIGMENTDYSNSLTTPYDIGLLFYKLNNRNIISSNSKKELLLFLTDNSHENLISAGVPSSVTVVHKYGADDGELNDAGIIFSSKPYILVVLSKDVDQHEAQMEVVKISKLVYDFLSK